MSKPPTGQTRVIWLEAQLPDGDVLRPHTGNRSLQELATPAGNLQIDLEASAFDLEEFELDMSMATAQPAPVPNIGATTAKLTPVDTHSCARTPDSSDGLEEIHLSIELIYVAPLDKLFEMRAKWRTQVAAYQQAGQLNAVRVREAMIVIANERLRHIDIDLSFGDAKREVPDQVSGLRLN